MALSLDQEALIKYLVPIQVRDIHLKPHQGLHQGDSDIGIQVISSAFKHRMSKSRKITPNPQYHLKWLLKLKEKGQSFLLQHFNTETQISGFTINVRLACNLHRQFFNTHTHIAFFSRYTIMHSDNDILQTFSNERVLHFISHSLLNFYLQRPLLIHQPWLKNKIRW